MISQDCCGGLRAGEQSPARFAFVSGFRRMRVLVVPFLVFLF
ncbi:hypothetical protein J2Z19_001799 [Ensifer adhaerens]|uniref:Uncharacterized protein n=1 Tax=Ensifer adhaerens TaxID=106592 RepID=A0ACC5STC3_ENSAD|nr:hypothetical protein [Ensifer adhaerens]